MNSKHLFAYYVALRLSGPNADEICYGYTWWPSYSTWMVPGTYVEPYED